MIGPPRSGPIYRPERFASNDGDGLTDYSPQVGQRSALWARASWRKTQAAKRRKFFFAWCRHSSGLKWTPRQFQPNLM